MVTVPHRLGREALRQALTEGRVESVGPLASKQGCPALPGECLRALDVQCRDSSYDDAEQGMHMLTHRHTSP